MNVIKHLKEDKIELNGIVYKPYKVCVGCSKTEKYGCSAITYHKTGNSIQIMSSSDAARIARITQRRGYGTMLK